MAAEDGSDLTIERVRASQIAALFARGTESGCIELSEISQLVDVLELDTVEVEDLYEEIENRGIEISDDCARDAPEQVTYTNSELAEVTTDALKLFLNEVSRYELLSAEEEAELAQRIEQGDEQAKDLMIN